MNSNSPKTPKLVWAVILACGLLAGCIVPSVQKVPNPETPRDVASKDLKNRRIEVFFDGTRNKWDSRTNVRRRFEMVAVKEDPAMMCFYVDGVGNESVVAAALGIGMKQRVVEAYKFISAHWYPGTKIRIYGFSRGALQARMLAGMMAHSGLVRANGKIRVEGGELADIVDEIWSYSRDELSDGNIAPDASDGPAQWEKLLADNRKKTSSHIRDKFGKNIEFVNTDIEFMGLWDTVPGLTINELKGTGGIDEGGGTRYKVRPYPNLKIVAHALALDEHRVKFAPLLVGGPLNPAKTQVYEVWFPGAHSDIGGGYGDSNDISGVTFNWMHKLLHQHHISGTEANVYADSTGIMHHPESSSMYRYIGGTKRREIPLGSVIDRTVFIRAAAESPREQDFEGNRDFTKAEDGYRGVPYRPMLKLSDGSVISIYPTDEPLALLESKLRLNDSRRSADDQKEIEKPIAPESLQLEMSSADEVSDAVLRTPVSISNSSTR